MREALCRASAYFVDAQGQAHHAVESSCTDLVAWIRSCAPPGVFYSRRGRAESRGDMLALAGVQL